MSAKELRLSIPGYSKIRWGTERTPGNLITMAAPRGTPIWLSQLRGEMANPPRYGSLTTLGWVSPKMNRVISDLKLCCRKCIPFKSTNVEMRVVTGENYGLLYCKGQYLAEITINRGYNNRPDTTLGSYLGSYGLIKSFTLPEVYDKFQLYLLRCLGVKVNRVGRKLLWDKYHSTYIAPPEVIQKEVKYESPAPPYVRLFQNGDPMTRSTELNSIDFGAHPHFNSPADVVVRPTLHGENEFTVSQLQAYIPMATPFE